MDLITGLAQRVGGGSGVTGLSWSLTGGNVFEGQMPEEPDVAVGFYTAGGLEADSALAYDSPNVQVRVRGDQNPKTATDLWRRVYDYLHALRYVTLPDGTFLVYALVMQSSPIPLGTDENGRYSFSMNLRCEIKVPTAGTARGVEW